MAKFKPSKINATRYLQIDFECDRLLYGLLAEFSFDVAFIKPPWENSACVLRKSLHVSQAEPGGYQSELPERRGMKNAKEITGWNDFGFTAVWPDHVGAGI